MCSEYHKPITKISPNPVGRSLVRGVMRQVGLRLGGLSLGIPLHSGLAKGKGADILVEFLNGHDNLRR